MQVIFAIVILVISFALGQIVANSRYTSHMEEFLQNFVNRSAESVEPEDFTQIKIIAYEKALFYERLIEESMLEDGMVVVRGEKGEAKHMCDSLLFSSLRYVALQKLGLDKRAARAWESIQQSQSNGEWFRHPQCVKLGTSRDMMLGILAAFSQDPPDKREILLDMIKYISENNGFFSTGPVDVSFLLPGVADLLRVYAEGNYIIDYSFPVNVRHGFSTMEFGALYPFGGYRSHLIALSVWLEMELSEHPQYSQYVDDDRNAIAKVAPMINVFSLTDVKSQRLLWISRQLFASDPENLFFKYLWLRAAGALNDFSRKKLLTELLQMKQQFPDARLPTDCNRKADYLWQRHSWEYTPLSTECHDTFTGVDFLWMASILLDKPEDHRPLAR